MLNAAPQAPSSWLAVGDEWGGEVASTVARTVGAACPNEAALHDSVSRVVQEVQQTQGPASHRLFALVVLGAMTGDPAPAVPVSAVSTLWWAGAEALDDIMDGSGAPERLTAAIACLAMVPQALIAEADVPDDIRRSWSADLNRSSVVAAEGQLTDLARDAGALEWAKVMRTCVAKTGAAYARDAVMAARLANATGPQLHAWHKFGELYGVLRQVHNDNDERPPEEDEDLANGTPTLMLAHFLDSADAEQTAELLALRSRAAADVAARVRMRELLRQPGIVSGYNGKIVGLGALAKSLLEQLAAPSVYRELLAARVDESVLLALPRLPEDR